MNILFLAIDKQRLYNCYTTEQIASNPVVGEDDFKADPTKYQDIEYIFSTWNMLKLTEDEIAEYFPKLKAVFYAAGSIKYFATPFLNRGVRVFSGWQANAIPVAEFLSAQIVLANKGYYQLPAYYRANGLKEAKAFAAKYDSNYIGTKVGFIGVGMITRYAINLLKPYNLDIYVCSGHMADADAEALGVKKASLEYIFENCQTISNNLANSPANQNRIDYSSLSKMRDYGVFINTGRGAQVNMDDLKRVMKEKPTATAVLDVTDPLEPMPLDNDVWEIPNIFITPHIAGAVSNDIYRMGAYMFEDLEAVKNGTPTKNEVTAEMLEKMA